MSGPTAAWPLPALLTSLAHADVPELAGRAGHGPLAVLQGLAACLPHGSASGTVTAAQVAERAGYSERRCRDALHHLEALGLVEWERGWRGHAGRMTIAKRAVVSLIRAGRRTVRRPVAWVEARTRRRALPTEIPDVTSGPTPYREVTAAKPAGSRPPAVVHRHTPKRHQEDRMIECIHHQDQKTCPWCRAATPTARRTTDPRPCAICWRPEAQCITANSKVPQALRHDYVAHVGPKELA